MYGPALCWVISCAARIGWAVPVVAPGGHAFTFDHRVCLWSHEKGHWVRSARHIAMNDPRDSCACSNAHEGCHKCDDGVCACVCYKETRKNQSRVNTLAHTVSVRSSSPAETRKMKKNFWKCGRDEEQEGEAEGRVHCVQTPDSVPSSRVQCPEAPSAQARPRRMRLRDERTRLVQRLTWRRI